MQTDRPWVESLVACVADPLALLHGDWTIVWANREFAAAVASDHGLKGTSLSQVIENWEAISGRFGGMELPGGRVVMEVNLLRAYGTVAPARLHLARCHPAVDAIWAIHLHDLGEVCELRRQLGERERSHSFLQAHTSDLLVRSDEHGRIVWTNQNAAALFPCGESLGEVLAAPSIEVLAANPAQRFDVGLATHPARGATRQLRGIARRLHDDDGSPIGLSLLLRDDPDSARLLHFIANHDLSPREAEIIEYLAQGYTNLNIAAILGLSESGIKFHVRNIFARTKVATRTELLALIFAE